MVYKFWERKVAKMGHYNIMLTWLIFAGPITKYEQTQIKVCNYILRIFIMSLTLVKYLPTSSDNS